jgi:predicted acetyltransferase
MTVETRLIAESEYPDWLRALATGFLRPPVVTDEEVADRRASTDLGRVRGAFDAGRCVATYRSFTQQLTTVGGARLAASAVSNVTVSPTHRRRGLLSRMIDADLAEAKERGDSVSTLIAAEYPIYGRYGYGPATTTAEWSVDVPRAGLDPRAAGP